MLATLFTYSKGYLWRRQSGEAAQSSVPTAKRRSGSHTATIATADKARVKDCHTTKER